MSHDRIYYWQGSRLGELLAEAGVQPAAFGEMIDATEQSVRNWMTGRFTPTGTKIARMASELGRLLGRSISPDDFFLVRDLTPDQPQPPAARSDG